MKLEALDRVTEHAAHREEMIRKAESVAKAPNVAICFPRNLSDTIDHNAYHRLSADGPPTNLETLLAAAIKKAVADVYWRTAMTHQNSMIDLGVELSDAERARVKVPK